MKLDFDPEHFIPAGYVSKASRSLDEVLSLPKESVFLVCIFTVKLTTSPDSNLTETKWHIRLLQQWRRRQDHSNDKIYFLISAKLISIYKLLYTDWFGLSLCQATNANWVNVSSN